MTSYWLKYCIYIIFIFYREEYNKLFDYVQTKGLKIRNAQRMGEVKYLEDKFADSSDDEKLDPYAEKLKKDAKQRGNVGSSDSEDGIIFFFPNFSDLIKQ